jgi:hypothetical protein
MWSQYVLTRDIIINGDKIGWTIGSKELVVLLILAVSKLFTKKHLSDQLIVVRMAHAKKSLPD